MIYIIFIFKYDLLMLPLVKIFCFIIFYYDFIFDKSELSFSVLKITTCKILYT